VILSLEKTCSKEESFSSVYSDGPPEKAYVCHRRIVGCCFVHLSTIHFGHRYTVVPPLADGEHGQLDRKVHVGLVSRHLGKSLTRRSCSHMSTKKDERIERRFEQHRQDDGVQRSRRRRRAVPRNWRCGDANIATYFSAIDLTAHRCSFFHSATTFRHVR
jgi:hypothetical protein